MNARQLLQAALFSCTVAVLAGCGGADIRQDVSTVSQGQELTDLKRALDAGALTQDEYDRLRRKFAKQ